MKTISAWNMGLDLPLVRAATSGYELAKCRIHPAQLYAFENLAICVREIIVWQLQEGEAFPDLAAPPQRTIAGVPVELDLDFPMTKIQFLNQTGEVVTEIENLAIPVAFA